jgi:CHASE2 domain-containing sensor protein/signal transduction histidine kinase
VSRRSFAINRTLSEWLLVSLFCAGIAAVATTQNWLWRIDGLIYDAALELRRDAPDPDVVVVAIDDRSLLEIGRWPWSRAVHAALLERLIEAGAAVVAFDIILHESDRENPLGDQVLAEAIEAHGAVVLPVTHVAHGARSDGEGLPAPQFADVAAALGHIHIELDPDGIARSVYLWEGMNRAHHPQFALAALALHSPEKTEALQAPGGDAASGWRRADWVRIPFIGPPGSFRHISYVDILRGDVDPAELRDAMVFVGATAVGMGDMVPTPTSGHAGLMPGVEIHATLFQALRHGDRIATLERNALAALAVIAVVLLSLTLLRSSPRVALLTTFAFIAVALAGAIALLALGSVWLPPAGAMLAGLLAYPLWSWRRLESAQNYLDAELRALQEVGTHFTPVLPRQSPEQVPDRFRARISVVREAAQRQRALQRFVADTLDRLPVGTVVIDTKGQVRLCNPRARALLGVDDDWAIRATLAAMPWPEGALIDSGLTETVQIEVVLDESRVLLVSAANLMDENGDRMGTVVGIDDLAELRRAQRSRDQTLHFLSHDLRAPMAAILTLAEIERAEGDSNAEDAFLARVERQARTALDLADNLIRLAKAENTDPARFEPLQLDMLVLDAADEVWSLARANRIEIVTGLESATGFDEARVYGDADLLRRALVNLLTNAIKHTPEGGQVIVRYEAAESEWLIHVEDRGSGIDPEIRERLFQPFSTGGGKGMLGGVGLGLLMVRTVAECHRGSVSVASEPGQGSTFTLRLPVA